MVAEVKLLFEIFEDTQQPPTRWVPARDGQADAAELNFEAPGLTSFDLI